MPSTDNGSFRNGNIVADLDICGINDNCGTNLVSSSDADMMPRDRREESNFCGVTDTELAFAHNDSTDMYFNISAYMVAL
jgi:hypothetical protein